MRWRDRRRCPQSLLEAYVGFCVVEGLKIGVVIGVVWCLLGLWHFHVAPLY